MRRYRQKRREKGNGDSAFPGENRNMKTLYLDCFSGISGDMVLGAFLDLGIEESYLKKELEKLHLDHYEIRAEKTVKKGISGTYCHISVEEEHVHRHFSDIRQLIRESDLDESVKETAIAIFRRVAEAEGTVHGVAADQVHFHEVGALDSILDIVGAAVCFHKLAPEKVLVSSVNTGSGWVNCAHGRIPVPAPAVVEILAKTDIPMYSRYIEEEAATPTGAAIAAQLAEYVPQMPEMKVKKAAYGFGTKDFPVLNGLRMIYGETAQKEKAAGGFTDEICVLESNIDDMTGESAGYVMERLFDAGAKDVFYTPVYMKKNRPAILLTVLAAPEDEENLVKIILGETTTIGVRRRRADRICMERRIRTVETPYGPVCVKECDWGDIRKKSLEYEDVARIAKITKKSHLDIRKELTYLL